MSSYLRSFWAFLRRNDTARGLFVVAIVLGAAVGVWYGIRLALNTEYPVLVVSSPSMCPPNDCTLPVGDLIVIRGQDPATIEAGPPCNQPIGTPKYGSIIVFRPDPNRPDYLVVHRVREIRGNASVGFSFQTKGDNNSGNCDFWGFIPESKLVGIYQYSIPIPYLGTAILTVRNFMYNESTGQPNPQGIAVIVALIIALFAFEVLEPGKKKTATPPPTPTSPVVQPQPDKSADPEAA